jgi:hypothetical protein
VIGARVVSWPLTGLFTDAPLASLVATGIVIAIAIWLGRFGTARERQAARWLGLGVLWTAFALTFISPSLATVVPGLPNDHYHAFADPMVFVLVGLGTAALWRVGTGSAGGAGARAGRSVLVCRVMAVIGVALLLGWNLANQPPAAHPDGGFAAADDAAARIVAAAGGADLTLRSLPDFKSTEAYAYPLVRAGATVRIDAGTGPVASTDGVTVVICDALFEAAIGASCGGAAEAMVAPSDRFGDPIDRFLAAPGRTISVYHPAP